MRSRDAGRLVALVLGGLGLAAALLVAAALLLEVVDPAEEPRRGTVRGTLSVAEALTAPDLAGFARAAAPRAFSFPRDHGPHPEFRTEWWHYVGNLRDPEGRHFGFQLTFFRTALAPPGPALAARRSGWAATEVYLAHFALTNTAGARFRAFSRSSRAALGLAGAEAEPFRVWVGTWVAEGEGPGGLPMRLRAGERGAAIDLVLEGGKPPVLQGARGLSQKGTELGNASYYYSLTRMPARGAVQIGAETHQVGGLAWLDREWSTSALGKDLVGWDWFALQLADGREVMFYQLRRRDGTADPWSGGTLIDAEGGSRELGRDDVRIEVLRSWRSPRSGGRYPARWRFTVLAEELALEITPQLADQELVLETQYWEGAVEARGTERGRPVRGNGYVELVGYGE